MLMAIYRRFGTTLIYYLTLEGVEFPKFRGFAKAEPNSHFRGIYEYIRNNLIKIWVSLICKLSGTPGYGATAPRPVISLPSVRN
jgi:hypothetical protein